MRYAIAAAALAGVVAAHGGADSWGPPSGPPAAGSWPASNGTDVYVTEVVTAFTTFCPVATQITHGGETYTVSSATTLTITNCPGGCTITKPVSTSVVTVCSTCATPITSVASATPTAPKPTTTPVAPGTASAPKPSAGKPPGTAPVASGTAAPSGSAPATPTTSPIAPYKGAATQVSAGFAGLLAAVGLAALL